MKKKTTKNEAPIIAKTTTTDETKKVEEVPVIEKKVQPLAADRMQLVEFARNTHVATIPEGVPIEIVLKPEYWAHVAAKLRRWDHIEVRAEDGDYWAELIVMSTERVSVKVIPIRLVELHMKAEAPIEVGENMVAWKGPQRKWAVIRKADNEYLSDKHESKEAAMQWLVDHSRQMAAA